VGLGSYWPTEDFHPQLRPDYRRLFSAVFATTPEQLIGLRILIGIGLGGDYSVGHTLLAEFAPRRHRGILLGAFSVVWTIGYVLASLAGHHFISENPDAWRWLLASSALPAC
jgi:MFS family permease